MLHPHNGNATRPNARQCLKYSQIQAAGAVEGFRWPEVTKLLQVDSANTWEIHKLLQGARAPVGRCYLQAELQKKEDRTLVTLHPKDNVSAQSPLINPYHGQLTVAEGNLKQNPKGTIHWGRPWCFSLTSLSHWVFRDGVTPGLCHGSWPRNQHLTLHAMVWNALQCKTQTPKGHIPACATYPVLKDLSMASKANTEVLLIQTATMRD